LNGPGTFLELLLRIVIYLWVALGDFLQEQGYIRMRLHNSVIALAELQVDLESLLCCNWLIFMPETEVKTHTLFLFHEYITFPRIFLENALGSFEETSGGR
jgi:hypothetical protein